MKFLILFLFLVVFPLNAQELNKVWITGFNYTGASTPNTTAINAKLGTMYLGTPSTLFIKSDDGLSTNWFPLYGHPATVSQNGYLSSSDFTTFTNKVNKAGDIMTGTLGVSDNLFKFDPLTAGNSAWSGTPDSPSSGLVLDSTKFTLDPTTAGFLLSTTDTSNGTTHPVDIGIMAGSDTSTGAGSALNGANLWITSGGVFGDGSGTSGSVYLGTAINNATPHSGGVVITSRNSYAAPQQDNVFIASGGAINMQTYGGNSIDAGGAKITTVSNPTNAQDAATKSYVDSSVARLSTSATTQSISAAGTISPDATYFRISAAGGVGVTTGCPAIANGTFAGEILVLINTGTNAATITIKQCATTEMPGGVDFTLQGGDSTIMFIWNGAHWITLGNSVNHS